MARVHVENLSLNYPLHGRHTRMPEGAPPGLDEREGSEPDRMIRDEKGAITGIRALQGISFTVESGDRLAILGENGSGKTTLLQVLAGIYAPDEGVVEIDGRATSIVNINLGMQTEASGHRNITLRGLASGHSRQEIEDKRAEIAAFSELGEFLHLPVETYSAGMRMRLNFAIATAFDPEILILDEWLSAGDTSFRKKASQRMKEFVGKVGVLIMASHSASLLNDNCNRAIWLDRGRIEAEGDVKTVLQKYEEVLEQRRIIKLQQAQPILIKEKNKKSSNKNTYNNIRLASENTRMRSVPKTVGVDGAAPDYEQPIVILTLKAVRWIFKNIINKTYRRA